MNGKILSAIIVFACALVVVIFWQNARGDRRQWQLTESSEVGDLGAVQGLIAEGADVNRAPGDQKMIGEPALIAAASHGRDNVITYLLAHGASVNIKDSSGLTPLAAASLKGYKSTVDLLLAHGADPSQKATPQPPPSISASNIDVDALINAAHGGTPTP